jgi:hypothetical protein
VFRRKSGPDSPWVETQHFNPAATSSSPSADFGGSLAVNRDGQAVIGTPKAYDYESQTEYRPAFLYALQGGQFVLSLATPVQPRS